MTIGTDGCSAMARIRGSVFAKDVEFPRVAIFATGGFVALSIVSYLALSLGQPLLVPSFGATAVILFSMPDSRAARPRNVFFGQVISALVSLVVSHVLGCTWYAVGLGVMLAMVAMVVTDTVHPPGGATAISCITASQSWSFAIAPVALGALVLIAVGAMTASLYRRHSARRGGPGFS